MNQFTYFRKGFLLVGTLLILSCLNAPKEAGPAESDSDAAIKDQVEESMEKAKDLSGPDSTLREREAKDSMARDSATRDSVSHGADSL